MKVRFITWWAFKGNESLNFKKNDGILRTFTTENFLYTSKWIDIKEKSNNAYLEAKLVISFSEYDFITFHIS